jgi:hypothetical protein
MTCHQNQPDIFVRMTEQAWFTGSLCSSREQSNMCVECLLQGASVCQYTLHTAESDSHAESSIPIGLQWYLLCGPGV